MTLTKLLDAMQMAAGLDHPLKIKLGHYCNLLPLRPLRDLGVLCVVAVELANKEYGKSKPG